MNLKGKLNAFPIIKFIFYILILIVLLLNGVNNYGATNEARQYLKSTQKVNKNCIIRTFFDIINVKRVFFYDCCRTKRIYFGDF